LFIDVKTKHCGCSGENIKRKHKIKKETEKKQEVESHFWENYKSGCFNVVDIQYNTKGTSEKDRRSSFANAWEYKPLFRKENRMKQMRAEKGGGLHVEGMVLFVQT
jgi:hypothetical protein